MMVGPGLLVVVGGGGVMVVGVGTMLGGAGFEFNANSRQLSIKIQHNGGSREGSIVVVTGQGDECRWGS